MEKERALRTDTNSGIGRKGVLRPDAAEEPVLRAELPEVPHSLPARHSEAVAGDPAKRRPVRTNAPENAADRFRSE